MIFLVLFYLKIMNKKRKKKKKVIVVSYIKTLLKLQKSEIVAKTHLKNNITYNNKTRLNHMKSEIKSKSMEIHNEMTGLENKPII